MSEERDIFREAIEYGDRVGTKMWLITFVAPVVILGLGVLLLRACC